MSEVGKYIIDTTESVKSAQKDFQKFTTYNEVFLVTAAAICVGMATRDMVTDIMNEVILPVVTYMIENGISYFLYKKALERAGSYPLLYQVLSKFGHILWIVLVWILILYVTYVAFKALIKIDLITDKADIVQKITRYITQEHKHVDSEHKRQPLTQQEHQRSNTNFGYQPLTQQERAYSYPAYMI
jgi:large-conductance mechanosensitive channel